MDPARLVIHKLASKKPKTHAEFTGFLDKERPDWIQALIPRRINAPSEYWPQKVFAVAKILAAIRNQVAHDSGNKLIGLLPRWKAMQPSFYLSKYPHFMFQRNYCLPPRARLCPQTYFWMRFHSHFPLCSLCSQKRPFATPTTVNVLTWLCLGRKKGRCFLFR